MSEQTDESLNVYYLKYGGTSISRIFDDSKECLGPCLTIYDKCDIP